MHQERDYPRRISGTDLANPDFAALARAYRRLGRDGGDAPRISPRRSIARWRQRGIRLLHLKTDVEQISNQTTIAKLRNS